MKTGGNDEPLSLGQALCLSLDSLVDAYEQCTEEMVRRWEEEDQKK